MIRNRKVKDPIVAITKGMSEGRSLEKAHLKHPNIKWKFSKTV